MTTPAIQNNGLPNTHIHSISTSSTSTSSSFHGAEGFESVVSRLTPAKRAAVVDVAKAIPQEQIRTFSEEAANGKLIPSTFNTVKFPEIITAALHQGTISNIQYSTYLRLWAASNRRNGATPEVKAVIREDGTPDPDTMQLIRETLKKLNKGTLAEKLRQMGKDAVEKTKSFYSLSEEQEKLFIDLIKDLPLSEQKIAIVEDLEPGDFNLSVFYNGGKLKDAGTISQAVNQETGVNVFCRIKIDGKPMRMIASTGIVNAYLKATGRNVRLNPVLSLSSNDHILDGLKNRYHDMGLPTIPGVITQSTTADGYRAEGEDFSWHDIFHAIRQADIPENMLVHYIAIAENLKSAMQRSTISGKDKEALNRLYEALIDAEFHPYTPGLDKLTNLDKHAFDNYAFFAVIVSIIKKSTVLCALKEGYPAKGKEYTLVFTSGAASEILAEALYKRRNALKRDGISFDTFFKIGEEKKRQIDRKFQELIARIHLENDTMRAMGIASVKPNLNGIKKIFYADAGFPIVIIHLKRLMAQ